MFCWCSNLHGHSKIRSDKTNRHWQLWICRFKNISRFDMIINMAENHFPGPKSQMQIWSTSSMTLVNDKSVMNSVSKTQGQCHRSHTGSWVGVERGPRAFSFLSTSIWFVRIYISEPCFQQRKENHASSAKNDAQCKSRCAVEHYERIEGQSSHLNMVHMRWLCRRFGALWSNGDVDGCHL